MARRTRTPAPVQTEVFYLMSPTQSLFVEVFPINLAALPTLTAYRIAVSKGSLNDIGLKLAERLNAVESGCWVWAGERLLTDEALNPVKLLMTIDQIRADEPKSFATLDAVEEDYGWRATPAAAADYVLLGLLAEHEPAMQAALAAAHSGSLAVEHTYQARPWAVDGQPALSLSVVPQALARAAGEAKPALSPIKPAQRTQLVKLVSDIAKNAGLISGAFSTQNSPELFKQLDMRADLSFGGGRVKPFSAETLVDDFSKNGIFWQRERFSRDPVHLAVVNTLEDKTEDFVEAMQRALTKTFGFKIELLKDRKVRVLSAANLSTAMRDVQKEHGDVVLVFLPDEDTDADGIHEVRAQAVGRGLPSLMMRRSVLHQPEAMTTLIMGVLARAGNVPFAFAEPLPYTDFVVGLDLIRERKKDGDQMTGMVRAYRSDGVLLGYVIGQAPLAEGEGIPYDLLGQILPPDPFSGRRTLIHYGDLFTPDMLRALSDWEETIGGALFPVSIGRRDVPQLYALDKGKIDHPKTGGVFRMSGSEALVALPSAGIWSTPLHLRSEARLTIDQAIHSVWMFTLPHYGALTLPGAPVTVHQASEFAESARRGILPEALAGEVPFWL